MSSLISKNLQVGSDPTATNNFTIFQPATPDGTLRIGNGNTGITSSLVTLTSGGNLGVGRTSPGERLSVQNTSMTSTTVGANIVAGFRSNALNADTCIALTDGVSASAKYGQIAGSLYWMTADTERMRLDVSGNLGLGVTPSAWAAGFKALQISANTALWSGTGTTGPTYLSNNVIFDGARKYINTSAATEYQQAAGVHYWLTAPSGTAGNAISFTQALTLDASGYLLVGATSTSGAGTGRFQVGDTNSASSILAKSNTAHALIYAASGTDTYFSWNSSGFLAFGQGPTNGSTFTERMRLDSSGNLLVGTTSLVANAGAKLTIRWDSANQQGVTLQTSSTTFNGTAINFRNSSGVESGYILQAANSVSYVTSSDYRLKHDIQPMTGALAKVAALKPCTYKWNADGSDGEGFIAHELAEVAPQCVTREKDAVDAEGKPVYQGIDTSFLVATLTAAIQELKAEFDAYKATHP